MKLEDILTNGAIALGITAIPVVGSGLIINEAVSPITDSHNSPVSQLATLPVNNDDPALITVQPSGEKRCQVNVPEGKGEQPAEGTLSQYDCGVDGAQKYLRVKAPNGKYRDFAVSRESTKGILEADKTCKVWADRVNKDQVPVAAEVDCGRGR